MQKKLFIDRFDGTLKPKTFGQWQLYHLWKCFDGYGELIYNKKREEQSFLVPKDRLSDYANSIDLKWLKTDTMKELFINQLLKSVKSSVKVSHVAILLNYRKDMSQNYIFSAPLTQTLKHTRANVSLDVLPEDPFCYYMEMDGLTDSDGTNIEGILVQKCNFPEGRRRLEILYYTTVNRSNVDSYMAYWTQSEDYKNLCVVGDQQFDIKELCKNPDAISFIERTRPIEVKSIAIPYREENADEKIESAVRRLNRECKAFANGNERRDLILSDNEKDLLKNDSFRTILNGILYILSGEEHLRLEHNSFPKKKTKEEALKAIYTGKGFYSLGKNVKFLRDYIEDGYYWAPFFRKKAHCSANKKTVFVKGHFKYFKNKEKHR